MEIIYSTDRRVLSDGQMFRNPRFFHRVESGVSKVYIAGHHPKIAAAYRKAGIPVEQINGAVKEKQAIPATFLCGSDDEIVDIPDNWRDLTWPELRSLAKQCGAPFAINRAEAIAAIEVREATYDAYRDEPPMVDM